MVDKQHTETCLSPSFHNRVSPSIHLGAGSFVTGTLDGPLLLDNCSVPCAGQKVSPRSYNNKPDWKGDPRSSIATN